MSDRSAPSGFAAKIRGLPLWLKIALPVVIVLIVAAAIGSADNGDDEPSVAANAGREQVTTTSITTTSTTSTTTTTTTTTLPPTTTAPPTTAPPSPPVTEPPAPASDCNPNYDPCVPNASDVDCAGGSGNGPAYTGPVRVIGTDVYDLDADNDGFACE